MSAVSWSESPSMWTASVNGVAVCALKTKDIGGCAASWLDGRMWAPPSHLPKAMPQQTRFFMGVDEAKAAVEQVLMAP